MVVEKDPNTSVRQLEAEAVLVAVVYPLGDEDRNVLGGCGVAVIAAAPDRHPPQTGGDSLAEEGGPGLGSGRLVGRLQVAGVEGGGEGVHTAGGRRAGAGRRRQPAW